MRHTGGIQHMNTEYEHCHSLAQLIIIHENWNNHLTGYVGWWGCVGKETGNGRENTVNTVRGMKRKQSCSHRKLEGGTNATPSWGTERQNVGTIDFNLTLPSQKRQLNLSSAMGFRRNQKKISKHAGLSRATLKIYCRVSNEFPILKMFIPNEFQIKWT